MKAVILVGGEGTRLRPLTCGIAKSMLPILNKPFLEHLIIYLRKYGVEDIILTVCYMPDSIRTYFGDGTQFGVSLTYVMENSPLGTAGAIKNVERYLSETFLVFNGDIFTDLDLSAMIALHREKVAKVTIALTGVDDPTAYGVVETDGQGRIGQFLEKPSRDQVTSNMINAGIYVLEPDVLDCIPPTTHFMFEHHLFPLLLERGEPLYGYPSSSYWMDIGTPEKYLQLHRDLLMKRGSEQVMMGEGCVIGSQTQLRGPVVIGDKCKIGNNTLIESSVLWQGVQVGRHVTLKDCIVASNCLISDDCTVVNSVLADNVVMAEGIRLQPGSKIQPGTKVEAGTS